MSAKNSVDDHVTTGLVVGAVLLSSVMAFVSLTSPSNQCARSPHHVYVVDHQACLPVEAFIPAR